MSVKECRCCGLLFTVRPQTPDQAYCSNPGCQRDRRKSWNKQKMRVDPDYRENQRLAQRAWHARNPDYWRDYRTRRQPAASEERFESVTSANSDASLFCMAAKSGLYWIQFRTQKTQGAQSVWHMEITPKCTGDHCKSDACKYRT